MVAMGGKGIEGGGNKAMSDYEDLDKANRKIRELESEADRYQALQSVITSYSWLADGRGPHAYDDLEYDADVRTFAQALLTCLPPYKSQPFQAVLTERDKLRCRIREMEATIKEIVEDDTPSDEVIRAILVKEEHWDRLIAFLREGGS